MLQVYLKPTNFCNVGCDFCYLPAESRADKTRMTAETLTSALKLITALAQREGHERISILYHGGEPLSLSPDVLMSFSSAVREGLSGFEIMESIQTSLIPLRDGHIEFLKERCNGFIGSSIDFTGRTINGSSERYIDLWMSKVETARAAGLEVAPIMVPTLAEISRPDAIYDWFKAKGFGHFNIERYNSFGQAFSDRPDNRLHAGFLTALFDRSMADLKAHGHCVTTNVIAASIAGVLHGIPGERWGGTCQRDFLVVNPDGGLNTCPDRMEYEVGKWPSVHDGIDAFQSSPQRLGWIKVQHVSHIENHCRTCEFKGFCKSGCPITDHQVHTGSGECAGYKSHLSHVQQFVVCEDGKRLASMYLAAAGHIHSDPYSVGMEARN